VRDHTGERFLDRIGGAVLGSTWTANKPVMCLCWCLRLRYVGVITTTDWCHGGVTRGRRCAQVVGASCTATSGAVV
jgi:hypothetical protein